MLYSKTRRLLRISLATLSALTIGQLLHADVSLTSIFSDHMVLQRERSNPVWGNALPNEKVSVTIAEQSHTTVTGKDGKWRISLDPLPVGGPYQLTVKGSNTLQVTDILVGDVWLCSGQSNMAHILATTDNAQVEIASANYPEIRLITVHRTTSPIPLDSFKGNWQRCTPKTAPWFSAVGYLFGQRIHNATGVPIGLIDNSRGGSPAEAWLPREVLANDERYNSLLAKWDNKMAEFDEKEYTELLEKYNDWKKNGEKGTKSPKRPTDIRLDYHRPANLYNGVLNPLIGYGIRGVIWYQGESNASRAAQYQHLFPLVINTWREAWQQGDFPFYWVQLADYKEEQLVEDPSPWAELREAQTMTLTLPNTGEAVIIGAGEGRDVHPRNKQAPANRLARWALARDYGFDIAYQSPTFREIKIEGNTATLTFDHVSKKGLYAFDTKIIDGFVIAGDDHKFIKANAEIIDKNTVKVWSDSVQSPVAVRYAWASNPIANLQDRNGLPVTPFRTDRD